MARESTPSTVAAPADGSMMFIEQFDGRALTRAIGADEGKRAALRHTEAQALQGIEAPEALPEVLGMDDHRRSGSTPRACFRARSFAKDVLTGRTRKKSPSATIASAVTSATGEMRGGRVKCVRIAAPANPNTAATTHA